MRFSAVHIAIGSFLLLTVNIGFAFYQEDEVEEWKAGVARVVITPKQSIWLGGYANRTGPSEGKLHDLWAKALALEDASGNRSVLVTMDLWVAETYF